MGVTTTTTNPDHLLDVLIIGGGAAGLSAALQLARSRRSVEVIDSGDPRNRFSTGVHALLGHDGVSPADLLAKGRAEVTHYGGIVTSGSVLSAQKGDDGISVELASGETRRADRLVIATGLRDALPRIPGIAERWGRDVIHCPYCHGWEVRDQRIAVLAMSPHSVRQALMFRQLSDDVQLIIDDASTLGADDRERLDACGIELVIGTTDRVIVRDDRMHAVALGDGRLLDRDVLVIGAPMYARLDGLEGLSLEVDDIPGGLGTVLRVDSIGKTSVEHVWAAGNVSDPGAQVGMAAAQGALVGAVVNAELIERDVQRALGARDGARA